jgi:hypothetical protein
MTIVEPFVAGLLVGPCLWFVAKWIERARNLELESIERQRREEDRLRPHAKAGPALSEASMLPAIFFRTRP